MKKILLTLSIPLLTLAFIWDYPVVIAYKDTYYTDSYNDENFRKLEVGMSQAEVSKMLGEPLNKVESSGKTYLWYSGTKNDSYFFVKGFILKDSKVIEKIDKFYVD